MKFSPRIRGTSRHSETKDAAPATRAPFRDPDVHGCACAAVQVCGTRSVVDDVTRIRTHPLVPENIPIYGYIYDVRTGKLNEVEKATRAGKATTA